VNQTQRVVQSRSKAVKEPSSMRKVVLASFLGTALETYDLYLYGTAAALIFPHLFFPNFDPAAATLLSLSTFAVSFVARPLGALVFGHYGDRLGRKNVLVASLLLMGLSTFAIGLLPSYDTIGLLAPGILVFLRFLQGFGFGGEYSGAVLMIVEKAPKEKRGFYGSLNNVGPVVGFLASTGVFILVSSLMSQEQLLAWGWRIPFLVSIVLVGIGLYIRLQLEESPVFTDVTEKKTAVRLPIATALRHYWKEMLLATGSVILFFGIFYLFSVFSLSYATKQLGMERNTVLYSVMIAMVVNGITIPIFSKLSDKVGRKKIMMWGCAAAALWAFPMFSLMETTNFLLMTIGFSVQMVIYAMTFGPAAAFLSELFGPTIRYTGMAVAYNIGGIIGAAFAPIVASVLINNFHASWPIALYIIAMAIVSFVSLSLVSETNKVDMKADRVPVS
jgi:metabolite-proton symporter